MLRELILLVIGIVFLFIVFTLRSKDLEISHVTIKTKRLPQALEGLKIAHFSDLHLARIGENEERLPKVVNGLSPDILVFSGDFLNTSKMIDECIQLINKFKAKYAKFGVWGNEDYKVMSRDDRRRLSMADISTLVNENRRLQINQENLWIVGVDDPHTGLDDLPRATKEVPGEGFKILLAHSPVIMEKAYQAGIDLILSGHTHGGQICVPLISHLIVHLVRAKSYIAGLYRKGKTQLYVTRGIGTNILPFRLFCPPEIALIKLEKG